MTQDAAHRLVFANQLRGLASLSVACSHLLGVFWVMRPFVSLATASPPQPGGLPGVFVLVSNPWFNYGPFGVGLFFLISGLVIPISLGVHSRTSFMLARLLRVYPTYVLALLLELCVLQAASSYWGLPFPHDRWTILGNLLLLHNALGVPSVDLVNWTLCIELKFYLLLALIAPAIRDGRVGVLFGVAGAILGADLLLNCNFVDPAWRALPLIETYRTESHFVVFMLIGVLFQFRLRGQLGGAGFVASAAVMSALFVACWKSGAIAGQVPVVTVNYFYALALFGLQYFLRRWIRPVRIIDLVATVSYPFYLIHSLIGFSLLKLLMLRGGVGYLPALTITVAVLFAVAALLHVVVERPTITLGRRLAHRSVAPAVLPA